MYKIIVALFSLLGILSVLIIYNLIWFENKTKVTKNYTLELPDFKSMESFLQSPWREYYLKVYGNLPETPPNVKNLWFIYVDVYNKVFHTNIQSKKYSTLCPSQYNQIYSNLSAVNFDENFIWFYKPPPYTALPSNSWKEVIHRAASSLENVGAWYYFAPGSGIYLNIGKTKAYQDHIDAVRDILGNDNQCTNPRECDNLYSELCKAALKLGYDTIQFLKHSDMRCGNTVIEIVDLHGVGTYACGSKNDNPRLRTGYDATLPCNCDNKRIYVNCSK